MKKVITPLYAHLNMLKIQERFASNYAIGVCSAIRSIVGDEAFAKLFGTENADYGEIKYVR